MTPNRRIALNIIATYGRSLYALVIGLFCGRWTLMALGQVDYGLLGVVGGLTAFITFFNQLLASAISRYYAFNIGKASASGDDGVELCRQWFSLAVFFHTTVPLMLIIIGYPIGIWAINNFLTIPTDRVDACIWVFRFACLACFIGMVNVPFRAMYTAKQYIAELTIYSFVTSTVNIIFVYYMITHPGVWLVRYSMWTCLLAIVPQLTIAVRAVIIFSECRFRLRYCFNLSRVKELGEYVFWQFFGAIGGLVRTQGMAILVNKYFGPALNATMNLAHTVAMHTETLSNAMRGAFMPAITTSAGANKKETTFVMAYRASKYGAILCLIFVLPLSVEIDNVLTLWLKSPPPLLAPACLWSFAYLLLGQLLRGIDLCFIAYGNIRKFMFYVGLYMTLSLPAAWLLVHFGASGFLTIFVVLVVFRLFVGFISAPLAKRQLGYSYLHLFFKIIVPILLASSIGIIPGVIIRVSMAASFCRIIMTIGLIEMVFLSMVWLVVLDESEKCMVKRQIVSFKEKIYGMC